MSFNYIGSCVDLEEPEELGKHTDMTDRAEMVDYKEMVEHCPGLLELADELGYERDDKDGLTLESDFATAFFKSKWGDKNCYYLSWSAFEFIYVEDFDKESPPLGNTGRSWPELRAACRS